MKYEIRELNERIFCGMSIKVTPGEGNNKIPSLWHRFMTEGSELLKDVKRGTKNIGLEAYPGDFMETHEFYYHAMVEIIEKVDIEGMDTVVLPKGKYIFFELEFDDISNQIQAIYKYIKESNINVNYAFDYEDYLENQQYNQKGQILNLAFLMNP